MFRFPLTLALLAACLAWPQRAVAAPISFSFSATVHHVDTPLEVEFFLGQSVSGWFTLDSGVADANADPGFGFYSGSLLGMGINADTINIGNYAATAITGSSAVSNDYDSGFGPEDSLEIFTAGPLSGAAVAGFTPMQIWMTFRDDTGTAVPDDAFVEMLLLGDWTSAVGELTFWPDIAGPSQYLAFTFDSITPMDASEVPEPVSLLLVGAGAAGLISSRRRQSARQNAVPPDAR